MRYSGKQADRVTKYSPCCLIMRLRSSRGTICEYEQDAAFYAKKLCTLIVHTSSATKEINHVLAATKMKLNLISNFLFYAIKSSRDVNSFRENNYALKDSLNLSGICSIESGDMQTNYKHLTVQLRSEENKVRYVRMLINKVFPCSVVKNHRK